MNLLTLPENIKATTVSQPIFLKGTSEEAILLIHGFTGIPLDMAYVAHQLNAAGFTVSVPRLPGHGTSSEDFLRSTWRDWLRKVIDTYLDLSGIYKKVYVAGLSMGGLLTLILASIFHPPKIATIAGAIIINDWRIKLTPILSVFLKQLPKKQPQQKYDNPELEYLSKEYWSYNWPPQGKQLYKLMKIARKNLKKVSSDILILASENDKTVPLKAAHYIYHNVSSEKRKIIVFKKSGHVMTNDIEKEKVALELIKWFKN
ncbi:alpha/beta fold hydrolase [Thermosipho ferrireducens]|uniref:Alpha/beta fold hydrolase n=1 Tax=Thermosipho ferrireducens TaxID=2571116 RepID=A0ABX7S902_9BACT|nr:alpha/beta fold hydrolase [Thermosipho ferrireducens]QTA38320.1 alpha/beta fold hydrolase [Thermosipho ferrireducens]